MTSRHGQRNAYRAIAAMTLALTLGVMASGCVETKTSLILHADGSGVLETHARMQYLFDEMYPEPLAERLGDRRLPGVEVVSTLTNELPDTRVLTERVVFDSLDSLYSLFRATGWSAPFSIEPTGDGGCRFRAEPGSLLTAADDRPDNSDSWPFVFQETSPAESVDTLPEPAVRGLLRGLALTLDVTFPGEVLETNGERLGPRNIGWHVDADRLSASSAVAPERIPGFTAVFRWPGAGELPAAPELDAAEGLEVVPLPSPPASAWREAASPFKATVARVRTVLRRPPGKNGDAFSWTLRFAAPRRVKILKVMHAGGKLTSSDGVETEVEGAGSWSQRDGGLFEMSLKAPLARARTEPQPALSGSADVIYAEPADGTTVHKLERGGVYVLEWTEEGRSKLRLVDPGIDEIVVAMHTDARPFVHAPWRGAWAEPWTAFGADDRYHREPFSGAGKRVVWRPSKPLPAVLYVFNRLVRTTAEYEFRGYPAP